MADRQPPRALVAAVIAARRALLALADRLIPANLALLDRSFGVGRTHVLGTIAELGVADLLADGPADAAALAARLGVDEDALHRVLRAAALEGVLAIDRAGRFSLTRLSRPLRSDDPQSMRDWVRYIALPSTTAAWAGLPRTVRDGRSSFRRVHGAGVWDWFSAHPEEEQLFAGAMRRITTEFAPALTAAYPWPREGAVCDVAGGVGTLLAHVLSVNPQLRGVLVDAPGVLSEADAYLRARGVRERVELVEGDIFAGFSATADVYLLKDVLHDWDDRAGATILGHVRAAMPAGARLVLVETLQERNVPNIRASLQDLQMLTQCDEGRQRSADELQALLRAAGLRPGVVRRTIGPALVEGIAG